MFAYVRIESEGNEKNKKYIVHISKIPKFKESEHKKNRKYSMVRSEGEVEVQILMLGESRKSLKNLIQSKRPTTTPKRLLETASESEAEQGKKKFISKQNDSKKLANSLMSKLEEMKSKKSTKSFGTEKSTHKTVKQNEDKNKENNTANEPVDSEKSILKTSKQPAGIKEYQNTVEILDSDNPFSDITNTKEVRCSYVESYIENVSNETIDLKLKVKQLLNENKILKKENNELKEGKLQYKKKYQEKEEEAQRYKKVNEQLQVTMIDGAKQRDEMFQKVINSTGAVSIDCNYPAIGSIQTVQGIRMVHIGRDVYITEREYSSLRNSCKTPSACAAYITTLVYETDELLKSTISGYTTCRSGKKVKCDQLDPIKLSACEDFYLHWMKTEYKPESKEDKMNFQGDLFKYRFYAGKKVAELKRPVDQKPKKRKRTSKEQSDDDVNTIFVEESDKRLVDIDDNRNIGKTEDPLEIDLNLELEVDDSFGDDDMDEK